MNKNVIMGIVAVIALGAAVFIMMNKQDATADDPREGMGQQQVWVCRTCKAEVAMSKQEWMDLARAGNFKCPSCGGIELANAVYCPNPACMKAIETIGHGRLPAECPHCHANLGEWRDAGSTTETVTPPPG